MSLDFSQAPEPSVGGGPLIPDGTLAGGVIKLVPNSNGSLIHTNDESGNRFFKAEIHIQTAPHKGRVIRDIIGVSGSEGLMNMSDIKIRAILETNGAGPANPGKYQIENRSAINGMRAAVKIGVDAKSDKPRNQIATYLSPIATSTKNDFERLTTGDVLPPDPLLTEAPGARRAAPIQTTITPPADDGPPSWLDEPERNVATA